jgi:hypothetical protein
MEITILEEKKIKTEDIPQIIHRIFSICKQDHSFPYRKESEQLESEIKNLQKKIKMKEEVIKKVIVFESQMKKRLSDVQDKNLSIREKILEALGSSLE